MVKPLMKIAVAIKIVRLNKFLSKNKMDTKLNIHIG